jgi:hypothetical protein
MTRRERLERKAEKRREWAAGRRQKADSAFKAAHAATAMIPMGQPILIGHHSEGRHRAAIARSDSAMGRAVESMDMAKHHVSKAAGLESQLDNSIFSDDPDAIEALEAKVAGLEAERERIKAINKAIRSGTGWEARISPPLTEDERADLVSHARFGSSTKPGYPSYKLSNLGGVIRNAKLRIEDIKRRQARAAEAEAAGGQVVKIHGDYASVTFAEKPERSVLNDLKAAGFHWSGGSWHGKADQLPEGLKAGE